MNDYGQLTHRSSVGQAVDALLDAFTTEAFGVYLSPANDSLPMEQGGKRKSQQEPQHQISTEGISIAHPAIYAEKRSFERQVWNLLRREYARLCDMGEGLCLKCRGKNDQPRRRFCTACENKSVARQAHVSE